MRIVSQRVEFYDNSTISQLLVNDRPECYILEDRDRKLEEGGEKVYGETAIPRGVYKVIITRSNRFKKDLPLLLDVEGFTGVRIHPGNYPKNTEGCLLPGDSYMEDFVGNSRSAFTKLFNKIEAALDAGEEVTLEVV